MSIAQTRFNESTNELDRAYWQGAIDGEDSGKQIVVGLLKKMINDDSFRAEAVNTCIVLIKGENDG